MPTPNYEIAWALYLLAAALMSCICWRLLSKFLWRELACLLECFLIAFLFTPWYVLPDQDAMAPAFIIFIMDLITIDLNSAIRALIPIILAMTLALVVALLLILKYWLSRRRRHY